MVTKHGLALFLLASLVFVLVALVPFKAGSAEPISFRDDVYPLLSIRCLECHVPGSEGYEKSGFDLRTHASLMKGTKFGPMVVAGEAFTSNLMVLIEGRAAKELRMPHGKRKLSACEIKVFRDWIKQGAKDN